MTMSEQSTKLSNVMPCKCRNFLPARMTSMDHETGDYLCVLSCMMCGRSADGASPKEAVEKWNKEHGEAQ